MASPIQRKAAIRLARQKAARRRMYMLVGFVLLIIVAGVGAYLYVLGQSSNTTPTNPDIMHAQINTTKGVIQIELYRSKAPKTVNNFVSLADSHFYDNLVWHRIAKGFVIQTGDPNTKGAVNSTRNTWGQGGSPQTISQELDPSLHNDAGYLGMARGGDVNSASSQFYINLVDNRSLDTTNGGYAVFGKVISGMDIVNAIAGVPVENVPQTSPLYNQPVDATSVMVTSITIS
ncbi:peptidylprolyl isomerase [Candidatus Bathyarchaeota archaeon]|nr:MAG: peptidylprolyl isomerase [Candidatus Bathyarchaeota archaeon]